MRQLEAKAWEVIVVLECELSKKRLPETVEAVMAQIRENGRLHQERAAERRRMREARLLEKKERLAKEAAVQNELESKFGISVNFRKTPTEE